MKATRNHTIKTCQQYEEASSSRVENNHYLRQATFLNPALDSPAFRNMLAISGASPKDLKNIMGRQNLCYTTYRRYYVWVFDLKHCTLFVVSHGSAGTTLEYALRDGSDEEAAGKEIMEYQEDLAQRITNKEEATDE